MIDKQQPARARRLSVDPSPVETAPALEAIGSRRLRASACRSTSATKAFPCLSSACVQPREAFVAAIKQESREQTISVVWSPRRVGAERWRHGPSRVDVREAVGPRRANAMICRRSGGLSR
jgi:hypothetical protein